MWNTYQLVRRYEEQEWRRPVRPSLAGGHSGGGIVWSHLARRRRHCKTAVAMLAMAAAAGATPAAPGDNGAAVSVGAPGTRPTYSRPTPLLIRWPTTPTSPATKLQYKLLTIIIKINVEKVNKFQSLVYKVVNYLLVNVSSSIYL